MTYEDRILSDEELSHLILNCREAVRINFGASGTQLKEDNLPVVFKTLEDYRDDKELEEHHEVFKL